MKNLEGISKNSILQNLNMNLDKIPKDILQANEINLIKKDNDNLLVINSDNKKFEYLLSQKKLIPLWETNWYQLKDREFLTLKKGLLSKLINLAAKGAGNLNRLRKAIKVSQLLVYYGARGKTDTITVKNLRKLLYYMNIPYDNINNKIQEIRKGKRASIKNPNFPINLLTPDATSIIGCLVSDGCISIDRKARMTKRVSYCTDNPEDIEIFENNMRKIFGEILILKNNYRNAIRLRIGTSIVADAFLKIGCILGNKTIQNGKLPWIILEGDTESKRKYLSAVFTDEGSVGKLHKPYINLSRTVSVNEILDGEQLKILDKFVEPNMKNTNLSIGYKYKEISPRKLKRLLKELNYNEAESVSKKLENFVPRLLVDESKLLNEFGIENKIYFQRLSKTSKGEYRVAFCLMISRKESVLKFYKKIGFQSSKKQKKLESYLKYWGWL